MKDELYNKKELLNSLLKQIDILEFYLAYKDQEYHIDKLIQHNMLLHYRVEKYLENN